MKMILIPILVFSVLLTGISPSVLYGAEINGSRYDKVFSVEEKQLRLIGVGLLRYWGFKVYTGAFYLEEGASTSEALSNRAKRIEIEYLRPIKGKDFGLATEKSIIRNVDTVTFNQLRPQIDLHNSLYQDVQPGDRYSLTYIPGQGTTLALNGKAKGTIEGADFAAALFSIWLGPEPINTAFKKQILGG